MSFKYRFILSFVLLEVFFIVLIVTFNFITINNSAKQLIKQKIESNISLLEQLVKVPISIYDVATLDNLVINARKIPYINSLVILGPNDNILSSKYVYKYKELDELIKSKKNFDFSIDDEIYKVSYVKIYEEDFYLGSMYIVFDLSKNFRFINENKKNTLYIILLEILISTLLSYFIGVRLTNMLTKLSNVAKDIGENKNPQIPFLNKSDEIGILAKSLRNMQADIQYRRDKLKVLAMKLNKQKNDLIDAHKYKDDFLANMSHELKTPLNSINVISSIMMKNKHNTLDEKQVKNLSIINSCGNDLLYLINDVLDLSKLEAGEITLDYSQIDFNSLIISVKEMFEPQVLAKNIDFIFEYDKDIGLIYSDKQRVKQIIKNLLSNALKFVSKGSISFIVKNEDDYINIIIKDTGIGISENKLEHIFDRFKQADSSTTRKYGGSGLGLAICKELLYLLNGEISVSSEVDKGSTFSIKLPKNKDKIIIEEKKKKELNKNSDILILNNDPLSFFVLTIELKKHFDIQQANNLDELISYSKSKKYFLVIIDISKQTENELSVLSDFIEKNSINYALIYEDKISKTLKEKASFIYKKPLDKDEFLAKINELKV
ncbi:MAG: sensor histidine kinase [Poseidonibacter sp.]|uniref:HAMP domain-containing sensor histidine kinase n=1 Tax=Poseidonibacter sp. TaxID=2321188 RepID=UPI00359D2193